MSRFIAGLESLTPRVAELPGTLEECWRPVTKLFEEATSALPNKGLRVQETREIAESRREWMRPETQDALRNVSNVALANTVRVSSLENRPLGTGFFVNNGKFAATNWHVVNGWDRVNLQSVSNPIPVPYRVLETNSEQDFAILQPFRHPSLDLAPPRFIPRVTPHLEEEEKLVAYGYPKGELAFSPGYFHSLMPSVPLDDAGITFRDIYGARMEINKGNSGSAVYDLEGKVIGYVSGKQNETVEARTVSPILALESIDPFKPKPRPRPEQAAYVVPIERLLSRIPMD